MRVAELELIRAIEVRAGTLFHAVGKSDIAEHPVPAAEELARFVRSEMSWVAVGDDDAPVGFVLVDVVDGLAHVEQVSIDPPYARRGIGSALIDHVGSWAAGRGMEALTLTTFRDVPWNGPYYARLGFKELGDAERGPELTELMADEARHGLDPAERVAMRREVAGDRPAARLEA
ncbi:GNAT family N-acetyltransferase [Winogradskya consettensis]|uniref:GCN5 family N-acetyltransferase n=1 Tax=Winogradskya consettensis TaxID=113560 RepID=A0A919SH31_9ACTN|nr:GCN5 family N-acetyltransferase [Actinoplanes consettensis]